jgi:hypothetical protein
LARDARAICPPPALAPGVLPLRAPRSPRERDFVAVFCGMQARKPALRAVPHGPHMSVHQGGTGVELGRAEKRAIAARATLPPVAFFAAPHPLRGGDVTLTVARVSRFPAVRPTISPHSPFQLLLNPSMEGRTRHPLGFVWGERARAMFGFSRRCLSCMAHDRYMWLRGPEDVEEAQLRKLKGLGGRRRPLDDEVEDERRPRLEARRLCPGAGGRGRRRGDGCDDE